MNIIDIWSGTMNEFILLAINDYFDSINWDNPDIMLSTQQYNRLSHMLGDQTALPEKFMNEFIELVIKTIAETVTDLTEQQRSEIKYALEQAIEVYHKDINGIKNKLNQNDKEINENVSLP